MKKIIQVFFCLSLFAFYGSSFAAMQIEGMSSGVVSNPEYPFDGKINTVSYYYFNGNTPKIAVDVTGDGNTTLQITFTGADLPVGTSLLNAVGKPLVISFADQNFTVSGVFTYNDKSLLNRRHTLKKA